MLRAGDHSARESRLRWPTESLQRTQPSRIARHPLIASPTVRFRVGPAYAGAAPRALGDSSTILIRPAPEAFRAERSPALARARAAMARSRGDACPEHAARGSENCGAGRSGSSATRCHGAATRHWECRYPSCSSATATAPHRAHDARWGPRHGRSHSLPACAGHALATSARRRESRATERTRSPDPVETGHERSCSEMRHAIRGRCR